MAEQEKRPVGRPRVIESPEEFDRRVDAYIDSCARDGEPILLTGMILALGLYSKEGFYGYAEYPEFGDSVKRARMMVEMEYEKRLNLAASATGPIFALKNFGWTDRQEIEHSGQIDSHQTVLSGDITDEQAAEAYTKMIG